MLCKADGDASEADNAKRKFDFHFVLFFGEGLVLSDNECPCLIIYNCFYIYMQTCCRDCKKLKLLSETWSLLLD